eukprot:8614934-Pyramimonas_sp.AAC.1
MALAAFLTPSTPGLAQMRRATNRGMKLGNSAAISLRPAADPGRGARWRRESGLLCGRAMF